MEVQTESERVRHSRKLVLEFLGSSVDLSLAGPRRRTATSPAARSATARTRRGSGRRGAPPAGERDAREAGHHHAPDGAEAARPRPSPSR